MSACAVTQSLDRHLRDVEEAESRDEQIDRKFSEMELDERCVAEAMDDVFSRNGWWRDPITGKAGSMELSRMIAPYLIRTTDASCRSLASKLHKLMKAELYSMAERAVDAENNRNAIDAAEARLAHDEMEDVA